VAQGCNENSYAKKKRGKEPLTETYICLYAPGGGGKRTNHLGDPKRNPAEGKRGKKRALSIERRHSEMGSQQTYVYNVRVFNGKGEYGEWEETGV